MERDPTAQGSLSLLQTLDTFPQLLIFCALKVSNFEEGKLQGLTMAKEVTCGHMKHPLQQFKLLLCHPYGAP